MMLADYVIPRKKPIKQREIRQINHIRNQCYYKYVIAKTSRGCKGSSVRINSFAGNRTWFIFTCRQLLEHYATVPLVFGAINLLHLKQFLQIRLWKISLSAYFKLKLFCTQLVDRCREENLSKHTNSETQKSITLGVKFLG